jgi:hypothetical protein
MIFTANLSANETAGNNTSNVNRYISCKTPICFKVNYDTLYKNHYHSLNNFSYDHCSANKFMILHQNIQGISNRIDEFLNSLSPNAPQIICLTEHHLRTEEIGNVNLSQYTSGATFCRQTYRHGGVRIFVPKNIQFHTINLENIKKRKTLKFVL